MILITYVLFGLILFSVFSYFFKEIRFHLRLMLSAYHVPGPPRLNILLGNVVPLYKDRVHLLRIFEKWSANYFPLYKVWAAHKSVIILLDPIDFESILSNMKHHYKSQVYEVLTTWLNTGLLTSSGPKWQNRRKILTPAFHFSILQKFVVTFNEETTNLVEELKKDCQQNVPYTDVTKLVTRFTLKTMGQTAMGTNFESNTPMENEYKSVLGRIADIYLYRLMRPWLLNRLLYYFSWNFYKELGAVRKLHRFTRHIIEERKKLTENTHIEKGTKRLAMLDLLLANRKSIDENGIREEVDTFMFEGHDTTSLAITYALMLIANHNDVQEKILDEMLQVLGDNIYDQPTINQLQDLNYMEMVIKEALRLYPSVHFISRELGEDFRTHSGYHLPKGSIIVLHIRAMHFNPDIYPDPERFDPDRFSPDNCMKRHPFAYVPFSAGPRNCIGRRFAMLELKAVLCGVLANFILKPVDNQKTVCIIGDIVLRSVRGVRVKFEPRPHLLHTSRQEQ